MAHALEDPGVLGGCVYYSQNREDLILHAFFPDVEKGFYIDIGAYDPDEDSVTKLFYLRGWRGINIEPQPNRYALFTKKRRRDTNLNIGIAAKSDTLTLRSYKSQGLATFSEATKKVYASAPNQDTAEFSDFIVDVLPLKQVLDGIDVPHIHFMKVDVEGLEYEALKSNDWQKYRPEVVCVEVNNMGRAWQQLLTDAGYELVFFDGLNEYYADMKTDRKKKFDYITEVVRYRGGGIRNEHFKMLADLYRIAKEKTNHVEELAKERDELVKNIKGLQQQIAKYDSIKGAARRLVGVVIRKVRKTKK